MSITVRTMQKEDIELIWTTPAVTGSNRPSGLYDRNYAEQQMGKRVTLLAFYSDEFASHVNIIWKPEYPPFVEKGIPEINDLWVLPDFRRRGIASALMDEAEKRIFEHSPVAGIGFGLHSGYGPAQRMYILRGYIPDGLGVSYKGKIAEPYKEFPVDDDLVLYLTKEQK